MSQLTISIKNEQLDTKNIEEITLNLTFKGTAFIGRLCIKLLPTDLLEKCKYV